MRTFVALNPEPDVRAAVWRAMAALRSSLGRAASWVAEPALHVTLKFIGERPAEQVTRLVAALRAEVRSPTPVILSLGAVGAFPSMQRPRVIWLGVAPNPALTSLYQEIEQTGIALGLPADDRPFHPHLTLGRVRDRWSRTAIPLADVAAELEFRAEAAIRTVDVMQSALDADGPRYRTIAAIPLGGGTGEH